MASVTTTVYDDSGCVETHTDTICGTSNSVLAEMIECIDPFQWLNQ
jgi:hypothetical protein